MDALTSRSTAVTRTCERNSLAKVAPVVVVGLVLLMLALAAQATASRPTPEQAVADLNAWRALAGLQPVTSLDPNLSEGCRLHNRYLHINHTGGHDEDPSLPGYTDLGAQAGGSSVLVDAQTLPRAGFEDAVFHRMGLLQPRMTTTWFDASSENTCMGVFGTSDSAATPQLELYPWPANGQRNVPTTVTSDEVPSPYLSVPGATKLGYLLSVDVNGPWAGDDTSHLTGTSLTADDGSGISVTGVDAAGV